MVICNWNLAFGIWVLASTVMACHDHHEFTGQNTDERKETEDKRKMNPENNADFLSANRDEILRDFKSQIQMV